MTTQQWIAIAARAMSDDTLSTPTATRDDPKEAASFATSSGVRTIVEKSVEPGLMLLFREKRDRKPRSSHSARNGNR